MPTVDQKMCAFDSRSPGRSRSKPLKPLRAGMPGDPGATVVTTSCAFYTAHEAAGATGTQHSPRPHSFGADDSCTPRALSAPRENDLYAPFEIQPEIRP